jgi:hypothetical protein
VPKSKIPNRKSIFFNSINDLDCNLVSIEEIKSDIFYVNLSNCTKEMFLNRADEFAKAKCVIYDFRWGSRFMITDIIKHLIDTAVHSAWMEVPEFVYPNQKDVTFHKSRWSLQPATPRFESKNIFINNPSVVSSGETAMGIIDYYNLATMVGETTAGCNGNVNWIQLPCGYEIMWTGMRVLKHDGSQLFLVGFEPDFPVERTLKGVMDWEDEVLEKAISVAQE